MTDNEIVESGKEFVDYVARMQRAADAKRRLRTYRRVNLNDLAFGLDSIAPDETIEPPFPE